MNLRARPDPRSADEAPQLPGLRTWRAVYGLVFASFLLWLGLLVALTRAGA